MLKLNIELPEGLFIAAKKRAADLRRPLRELVEAGLRAQLASVPRYAGCGKKPIRWVTVDGGLPPGMDVANRPSMYKKFKKANPSLHQVQGRLPAG